MSDPCEHCQGAGQYIGHAPSCADDLCALNGDEHSCLGVMEPCICPAGLPYRLAAGDLALARWNEAYELRLPASAGGEVLAVIDTSNPWNYVATLYDGQQVAGWPMAPVKRAARAVLRDGLPRREEG